MIPTPWPDLTALAEIRLRRKVGLVAERGTREAKVGRDIAVHAAKAGIPTVLYSAYPPARFPSDLVVDQTPDPTAQDINDGARKLIGGAKPRLMVIERYERLRTPDAPYSDEPVDDPEGASASWGDKLMWAVRDIRIDIPLVLTTVVNRIPTLRRSMAQWLPLDHPAMVMTDVCKPLLVLQRIDPARVMAMMEVDLLEFRAASRVTLDWAPLDLKSA